ncbi:MNIO family bufferin maturase [Flavobacterium sp. 3HN19-14]|uniref:MNIO family bufferin maturase n=1 Tax=Flavobacterium sp. 3HN19-14 TaxID=3448133 RepID=UPI003EE2F41B
MNNHQEPADFYSDLVKAMPNPGLGLGLRSAHFDYILENNPSVDWFEIISENFMDSGGRPRNILRQITERYPVVMHGVSLSVGSTDPLNFDYLSKLKNLASEVKPLWISDHLCWTGINMVNTHDLLPVVLNEESLKHIIGRIKQIQDYLERPLVIENPSTYLTFKHSTIAEWDFLRYMAEETGCGLLLDVNNVYVSGFNNDFDPIQYVKELPHDRIVQMHIAGHQHCGDYIIDTHDRNVVDEVWTLFSLAWQLTGGVATLLEWDSNIPDFGTYHAELLKAKQFMNGMSSLNTVAAEIKTSHLEVSNPVNFLVNEIKF